jgi:hypothetical protein
MLFTPVQSHKSVKKSLLIQHNLPGIYSMLTSSAISAAHLSCTVNHAG